MQQDQFGNQLTLMKKQHEYNEESANAAQARAYEMWEKTNYAAQIEQMKKAGLSPALMYGQAGAGGGTVSGAQGQGTSQPTDRSIEMKLKGQEMENEAKKILNDIVISGKKLTLEQQQQLLDVVLGLGGLATRAATIKGGNIVTGKQIGRAHV